MTAVKKNKLTEVEKELFPHFKRVCLTSPDLLEEHAEALVMVQENKLKKVMPVQIFYNPSVKGVRCFVVFDDNSWFVESQPHTQFEHHVRIFPAHITNDYWVVVKVLNYSFVNYADFIRFAYQVGFQASLVDGIGNNIKHLRPVLLGAAIDGRNRHNNSASNFFVVSHLTIHPPSCGIMGRYVKFRAARIS
jgi:hypothetical protein